ncbi:MULTISPECIES: TolB family protein [unclassified Streptomyces]|uniref:TolB family protein n=1 Tax=unclassified Streptomyces TaxID=2593676 RepID=UPI003803B046
MTAHVRAVLGAAPAAALLLALGPAAVAAPPPPRVERISTATDGSELTAASGGGVISGDGRYAVFSSADPEGGFDTRLYLKDLRTGRLTQVPEDLLYTTGPMLSGDGRRLAYSNGNRYPKPYVYDRVTGRTEVLWPEGPPQDTSYELGTAAAISADGRHVAYTLGNRHGDDYARVLYVRDLDTGTDRQISPLPAEGMILNAWFSADGRTVAYSVAARTDHGTEGRIHVVRGGNESAVGSGFPATLVRLSDDGRSALFNATAADWTTTAYVQDLRTGRVRQVAGTEAVAADGSLRHVLLSGDGGLDLLTLPSGRRHQVAPAGATASPRAMDRRGHAVVFSSPAADLVPHDTNGVPDVFVRRLN